MPDLIHLGDSAPVSLDLDRLIVSRLLIAAMSGAGKSWLLRRLLEQTHGKLQHIVIDPEGEFYTLREKYDYVLARPKGEGDCPADPKSASLLAHSLLELGVSAILDIYELSPKDRILFVKNFLVELINAPKKLWHRALVVVDEAATFCPEGKDAESSVAVMDLMNKGRKRGFCGVLAAQRISQIDKNAIAAAGNLLIGRNTLDIDVDRACKTLGFSKQEDKMRMRSLRDGQFFAYGPAMKTESGEYGVTLTMIGGVKTLHPKAGALAPPPAPPRDAIKAALSKLVEIPAEVERKQKTEADLRAEIAQLKSDLKWASTVVPKTDPKEVERVARSVDETWRRKVSELLNKTAPVCKILDSITERMESLSSAIVGIQTDLYKINGTELWVPVAAKVAPNSKPLPVVEIVNGDADASLSSAGRKILTALAQNPSGMDIDRLAALSGYTVNGHFNSTLGKLRTSEYVTPARVSPISITPAGLSALGSYDPLPTGKELRDYWLSRVGSSKSRILRVLFDRYPDSTSIEDLAASCEPPYTVNGHFNNMMGSLRTMGLITPPRQPIKAMDYLFEE